MERGIIYVSFCFLFGLVFSTSEPNAYAPVIVSLYKNSHDIPLFRGKIREDETTVRLEPHLSVHDNDTVGSARFICRFEIVSHGKSIPFIIELKNRQTGEAVIKLKEGEQLIYQKRKQYKFNIYAYDCSPPPDTKRSNRAVVTIKIEDVDRFHPVFEKTTYNVEMEENKLYESIIQIKAIDRDRSPENSGICRYDLDNDDVPFIIDKDGNLKNTKVVRQNETLNFILKVFAQDCRGLLSNPAYINVQIKETCRNGWRDFPEHIEYTPGSGHKKLTENAHLQICDDSCKPDHVTVRLQLATKHIGKGCDRDTYSISSQRKLCGASDQVVDLLPTPILTSNWTNTIPSDVGNDGDRIYAFDGISNAVDVPEEHVDHKLSDHFTISTWMKHSAQERNDTDHKNGNKENIVCMSDGNGKNRQHYSLFIHNSKLIFLLRQESKNAEDLKVFKPAEFRYTLEDVNDGQWHHYAISMDFPHIHLYVDGKLVESSGEKFEILDDSPLHPADSVQFTKLVVGACWRGLDEKYTDHFHGYLAGLLLLKDKMESENVTQCLIHCQEHLDLPSLEDMPSGTLVSFNSDMTELIITGKNILDVEKMVRELAYINYRTFPTPGHRHLAVRTSVHCGVIEEILPLVDSYIYVQHSNKPIITVSGHNLVMVTKSQLFAGVSVFMDLSIHVDFIEVNTKVDEQNEDVADVDNDEDVNVDNDEDVSVDNDEDVSINETLDRKWTKLVSELVNGTIMEEMPLKKDKSHKVLLDMCTIRAEPVLSFYVEHLDLPKDDIRDFKMKLEGIETAAGVVILNADSIENYLTVLQHIRYMHTKADEMQMRKLFISCSSQSGRFVSKEFPITILLTNDVVTIAAAHIQNDAIQRTVVHPQFQKHIQSNTYTNVGMIAIIAVCVGFLLFMIVLGVLRICSTHNPGHVLIDEKQEMDWDNSELNIIVNPIDQELFGYQDSPKTAILCDDSDTDDVSEIYNDENDSSEDETKEVNVKNLEWDNSTLSC